MVDAEVLKKAGYSQDELRKKLAPNDGEPDEKHKRLIRLNADRIDRGVRECLDNARTYWAIDRAYDVSHRQISFTLLQGLVDRDMSTEEVNSALKEWGLTTLLTDQHNPDGTVNVSDKQGDVPQDLDLPTFFHIFVPMVMSYVKIRWAKLFNDRDQYPTYKYEPARLSSEAKIKSDIITDRIQRMVTQMGYRNDERQSILQCLLYSWSINFPREPWHQETQDITIKGEKKEVVIREGVRYVRPHPSRCAWDQAHPLHSLNTNTGCEYGLHWDVWRYGEVHNNEDFWNRDKISYGGSSPWWDTTAYKLYRSLYPCVMEFPNATGTNPQNNTGGSVGTGDNERQNKAYMYSPTNDDDAAVAVACIFHRLIPKDWDLFDYDKPIWMRFVYANNDTLIHAEPWLYDPMVAYMYDWDENRALNTSLALELIPWQDHIGNYLTQQLLSVKQNLIKIAFTNTDLLNEEAIELIKNLGEKQFRTMNFIKFSKQRYGHQGQKAEDAIHTVDLPQVSTNEIAKAIQTMITVMERLLGFSPQEMGSAASHEQSASEVSIIQANTGVRLSFTEGFLDDSRHARKNALYNALLAHGSDDVFAQVADLHGLNPQQLEETYGWKINPDSKNDKFGIELNKKDLLLDGFVSVRDGDRRIPSDKVAQQMLQAFQGIFSNPEIIARAGIEQVFNLFNQILIYSGVPDDFRVSLKDLGADGGEATPEQAMEQMAQVANAVVAQQMEQLGAAIKQDVQAPLQEQTDANTNEVAALKRQLQEVLEAIQQATDESNVAPAQTQTAPVA